MVSYFKNKKSFTWFSLKHPYKITQEMKNSKPEYAQIKDLGSGAGKGHEDRIIFSSLSAMFVFNPVL